MVSQEFRSPSIGEGPQSAAVAIERNSHQVELDAFGIAALDLIDGTTSIRHLLDQTAELTTTPAAQSFFQQMADWDHFLFEIP
jgi:hypothetical protein